MINPGNWQPSEYSSRVTERKIGGVLTLQVREDRDPADNRLNGYMGSVHGAVADYGDNRTKGPFETREQAQKTTEQMAITILKDALNLLVQN